MPRENDPIDVSSTNADILSELIETRAEFEEIIKYNLRSMFEIRQQLRDQNLTPMDRAQLESEGLRLMEINSECEKSIRNADESIQTMRGVMQNERDTKMQLANENTPIVIGFCILIVLIVILLAR